MIDLKLLKFLHKLNASKLPQYFNSYKPYLKKNETKYNLRPNPLVVPAVNHVYAENLIIYRLVKLKNIFSLHYPLVDDKLNDGTHSLVGFGRYIAKVIIDKYLYQCSNNPCLPSGAPNSAKFRGGCRGPSKIRQRGGCNNFLLFTR